MLKARESGWLNRFRKSFRTRAFISSVIHGSDLIIIFLVGFDLFIAEGNRCDGAAGNLHPGFFVIAAIDVISNDIGFRIGRPEDADQAAA